MDPQRGQIWSVNFDPQVGHEIGKRRPALVVNAQGIGKLPLRIVVPITDWKDRYASFPWFTKLPPGPATGLTKWSGADSFQVKSVALGRFQSPLGKVSPSELQAVLASLALCIDYHS
ncbi:type II toxin-antitoxin system PemK/MazF family toxin [bacterium]|nr:type II toxin-antitoxin system PemK/MazF family toxin [bacterium]